MNFIMFYKSKTRETNPLLYKYNQQRKKLYDDINADRTVNIIEKEIIKEVPKVLEKEINDWLK